MLHVHRSERADCLAAALGDLLRIPPADPFAREIVAVPTRGMERWLTQRLSATLGAREGGGDGVCANVEFPFPGRLIGGALATASGVDPAADPWAAERMAWALRTVIEAAAGEAWLDQLTGHLEAAGDRRFARIRQIALLFDHYAVRRPGLIQAWAAGADATGAAAWQSELWRRLRDQIGLPSGPERLESACARLREEPGLVDLPDRLALFGLTRLAPSYLEAIRALAAERDVHLFVLHPSPALWRAVAEVMPAAIPPRAEDPTAHLPRNRLLGSWGRDSRELQIVLGQGGGWRDHHHPFDAEPPRTLLGTIQHAVRTDAPPPGTPLPGEPDRRLVLTAADTSIRVHACHGRQRQVEVLREAILHRLAEDPTLEPRDVIVMCPDIETFAPLIQAAFGTAEGQEPDDDGPGRIDLRVRLADRSLRQTNPVLSVVARLLGLAKARLTASELLDFADTDPVRRRFDLDDEDLARIHDWIVDGGIHWGLGAEHRRMYGLEIEEGTWSAGVRRVLLGASMSEAGQRMFGGVLPVDDVDSGDIDLAGRFAELVDRLAVAVRALAGPHTIADWAEHLTRAADALTATPDRDAWQRHELRRILDDLIADAPDAQASTPLALPEIRALLADRLAGRPTRANFRTGHLTICTLVPMRSVPHRLVCLLGLDDGAFPRRTPRNGDDLLLEEPHVGDRDPRSEDRQLLLDALLAAGDALIVTYSGHDERTNAPLPPAVPVGELLDAVDATAVHDGDPECQARRHVLVEHPLQPFDPRNFVAGRLRAGSPWSFDAVALDGARALEAPRAPRPPFLREPLPPEPARALALADLVAFVERPVRAFLRQRLRVAAGTYEDEVADGLPVQLDGLERYGVGQRILEAVLAGAAPRDACLAEQARGTLPPGALGVPVIKDVWPEVDALVRHARAHGGNDEARSLETNFRLPRSAAGGETRITGTVSGVRDRVLLSVSYSRLSARHRLAAWVRLLALSAAHPDVAYEAVTIGRAPRDAGGPVLLARIPGLGADADRRRATALRELDALADLRALGMREPLPLPCATAAAWAEAVLRRGADDEAAIKAARGEWESGWRFPKEDQADEHVLAFGGVLALDELLAVGPRPGDPGIEGEGSRFARLAAALWQPLLSRETLEVV